MRSLRKRTPWHSMRTTGNANDTAEDIRARLLDIACKRRTAETLCVTYEQWQ